MGTVLIVTGTGFAVFINFVLYCCLRVASEADEKMERAYMFSKTYERNRYEEQDPGLDAPSADCEAQAIAMADTGTAANAENAAKTEVAGNADTTMNEGTAADAETAADGAADMEAAVRLLIERNISVSTMESCTSGLLASWITDTEGASAVFKGAFVTYSNETKVMQGVPEETIAVYGVYSLPVAEAMARACRDAYGAQIGIGVTGTTGNTDPNNADSVPGEICYAILWNERKCLHTLYIGTVGLSRRDIKRKIVAEIARTLKEMLSS